MRKLRISRRLLASAPLLFVLAACDANNMTEPTAAPSAVAPNYDYKWGSATIRLVETPDGPTVELTDSKLIGRQGGTLRLGLHELVVPRRAVDHPTRFTITMQYGRNLVIDLTAVDQATGASITQFDSALQLKLSYWMLPVPRSVVNRLVVVWLKDGDVSGELVPVKTTLQPGDHYIVAWLTHFSKFAMGMN
jgi:hypothetical protein